MIAHCFTFAVSAPCPARRSALRSRLPWLSAARGRPGGGRLSALQQYRRPRRHRARLQGWRRLGHRGLVESWPRAPAKRCCAATWSHGFTTSMPSTMTAAANGRDKAFMCTRDKEFTIRGTEDCLARGFDRTGFFEVDTGEQRSWTVQLTETSDQTPRSPLQPDPASHHAASRHAAPDAIRRPPHLETSKDETTAPNQDRRHARPGLVRPRHDRAAVRGRRRRVPHQHEPHLARPHARTDRNDPRRRGGIWPADRDPGRSAGAETAARHLRRRLGDGETGRHASRSIPTRRRATRRASTCRIRKSCKRRSPATSS